MKKRYLAIVVCLFLLAGCKTVVILHPIEKADIFTIPKGATVTIPAGTTIEFKNDEDKMESFTWEEETTMPVEKNGSFVSNMYIEEVMRARTE